MRLDAPAFAAKNLAAAKSPRMVVKIEYTSVSLYLSSHSDITGIPATHIAGCLIEPSITSQRLNPDQARAEIGSASFTAADVNTEISDNIRALNAAGQGLRGRTCRFYLGYEGLAWSDFVLVGTQVVSDASYDRGAYKISCNDVQRSTRKDIFDLATTTIASTVEAADTTINVVSTTGFLTYYHGAAYSDAPSSTVGYLKLRDEVVRYTGLTATSFTGCTRGVLGTQAARYVADGATPSNRREKVTEYVYLELPGPKLAYALLTGTLYGDSATLPAKWHLGISGLVRAADFTDIGKDLWNTAAESDGVVLRFEGITKTDGKAFIETEILRPLGLFMPVYATGELGLRRMTRVLSDAAGVATLDESNSVSVGELQHDMDSLHNAFVIRWNWNGKDYTRQTVFIDTQSANQHGTSDPLELKLRGFYGGRHTDSILFRLLDQVRDRYAAPPLRHKRDVFHSLNTIEPGDVVRVRDQGIRDFMGTGETLDRAFEVQSVSVNPLTGAVSLDLFGSTGISSIQSPTTATSALPDAFYTATGTNLTSVATITGGVMATGSYTLAGGADLTTSVWYYNGDLTIPAGCTLNISGNVQLRVRGYLTVNGQILGVGGGKAGVADNGTTTPVLSGNPGYVGNARGSDGITVYRIKPSTNQVGVRSKAAAITTAANQSFPYLALEVSGSTLKGLPTDLRGTGGGPGGKVVHDDGGFYKSGGTGGNGGAGLCTISRGLGVGANALIDLSGANTTTPSAYSVSLSIGKSVDVYPGAGAPGGPGGYLCLIDGALLSVPDLAGRLRCRTGIITRPTYKTALADTADAFYKPPDSPIAGWLDNPDTISDLDLSFSASRIQYVPAPETATADSQTLPPVEGVTVTKGTSGYTVTFTPGSGTPAGAVFEVWDYTSATPFSSATKRVEGASTSLVVPRADTNTVYCWVRAKYTTATGAVIYSTESPSGTGLAAGAAAVAGTYATASPTSASATAANSSLTTSSVTASLVGGTGTTFSWAKVSGDTFTITSPSSASTTFSITGVGAGVTRSAVYRCTINSTYTIDVSVTATNTSGALAATASPTTLAKTGSGSSLTTASTTVSPSGGAGGYTHSWAKVTGGSITADSPTSATTTFSATGLADGETRTATFRDTVTDAASATVQVDVSITMTRQGLSVTLSTSYRYKEGAASSLTTASVTGTPSGGTAPYTYSWAKQSGGSITVNSPTAATSTFVASGLASGENRTAVYRLTVTDALSATAYADLTVEIQRIEGLG